ncbi:ACP phosphodiesterase [Rouxiella silvae]|uniref:ACP phosphodiesterase n=1 Tax=Rouxiella silvae TaxID=1646373 RepID=A0ABX3U4F4_9GAMM|nr:ACP phosphodiesterase [Rouxiella silvae]KQN47389.1 ACP phosphodiesterase [Serratia sp. Leaf50]ORJ22392.1 ACP phosphodiesterase [Rouxiella silvae]
MNFLAHLHLAKLADSSLLGNLMADFVRGNPDGLYSEDVTHGIRMHRRVDVMTDSLPEVKVAREFFSADYRRVSPITLDVVWDHFLSLHWDRLCPETPLPLFINQCRLAIEPHLSATPERFRNLNTYLWPQRWMERYAELAFIKDVLQGMANRRPKLAALAGSFYDVERNYALLERQFWQFYPQMMQQARNKQI